MDQITILLQIELAVLVFSEVMFSQILKCRVGVVSKRELPMLFNLFASKSFISLQNSGYHAVVLIMRMFLF